MARTSLDLDSQYIRSAIEDKIKSIHRAAGKEGVNPGIKVLLEKDIELYRQSLLTLKTEGTRNT